MALEVKLERYDRTYQPGETVRGVVVVMARGGSMAHNGITMNIEGQFMLQLSPKSTGLFEAFYSSLKPVQLFNKTIVIQESGKLPDGDSEFPFEFKLQPDNERLYDTYHGVYVNVQYSITCECQRSILAKNLKKVVEFIVNSPPTLKNLPEPKPVSFKITPQSLENIRPGSASRIPKFCVTGRLDGTNCNIARPLTGSLIVEESQAEIRSVELQLVRVETCGTSEGMAKEASEIQSIQVAEGNISRMFEIPLYMIFPRLFTCPTVSVKQFKVDFEVNLIVHFVEGYTITENFCLNLYR